ncbi:hypothetical protein KBC89_01620 [Candidatus Woesebacteria bacterium]|nr:hypothetical protein [Candidatus Woesebacteria bacterium]
MPEHNTIVNNHSKKVFSTKSIVVGSFLGGLLAGGYFLFHNFNAVGKQKIARNILVGSLLFTFAIILFLFFIDGITVEIPSFLIPVTYTMVFMQISNFFFQKHGELIKEQSITLEPWYRTVAISVLGLLVFLSMYVVIYFLIPLQYLCAVPDDSRGSKVYDQFEADCMIYEGLGKTVPFVEIDTLLTLESEYLEKEGLYSENNRSVDSNQIINPQPYILENYSGSLTTEEVNRVLDYELNYLKFIGVVDGNTAI